MPQLAADQTRTSLAPHAPIPFGRYRLLEKVGEGGMAEVYRAEMQGPVGFSKVVALKLVHATYQAHPEFVRRFMGEAVLGGYLSHPNIVETLDFGEHEGRLFLAMEYVPGPTLEEVVSLHRHHHRPIPLDVALQIVLQVAAGLESAHEAVDREGQPLQLVHRDLKPSNILLSRHGIPKVADFGVARAASNLSRTEHTGFLKGTVRYMSPEQAWGSRDLDRRSDLFTLGLILFELVTLETLYDGDAPQVVLRKAQDAAVAPRLERLAESAPPAGLLELLRKLLAASPSARPGTAAEVADTLEMLLERLPGHTSLKAWTARLCEEAFPAITCRFISGEGGEGGGTHQSAPTLVVENPEAVMGAEAAQGLDFAAPRAPEITAAGAPALITTDRPLEPVEGKDSCRSDLHLACQPSPPPQDRAEHTACDGGDVGRVMLRRYRGLPLAAVAFALTVALVLRWSSDAHEGTLEPARDLLSRTGVASEPEAAGEPRRPAAVASKPMSPGPGGELPPRPPDSSAAMASAPIAASGRMTRLARRSPAGPAIGGSREDVLRAKKASTGATGPRPRSTIDEAPPNTPAAPLQAATPSVAARASSTSTPAPAGTLILNSRPPANIYLDGAPVGSSLQGHLSVPAAKGEHTLAFSRPDAQQQLEHSVQVKPDQVLRCVAYFESHRVECR